MARFSAVRAQAVGASIHLQFKIDTPGVIGWQLFDPATWAYLFEGEWSEAKQGDVELRITLPAGDGGYQVQVAPIADRSRVILVDARVSHGALAVEPPRVAAASSLKWARLREAIPKAFTFPVRSLWTHKKLIGSMVKRDILARYRGSLGGALWTFLNPLLLMLTYLFVFGVVMQQKFGQDTSRTGFVLYFLAGMLPWLAFAEAAGRSPHVIPEHRNFVKKLVFPLDTLPVNLVIAGLVTEIFTLAIFLVFLLVARGRIPLTVLWLPALLVPQLLLTAAVCWILAALGAFFRDLTQIVGFLLQLIFFMTPILYPEALILSHASILRFSPMLILVRSYRDIFLEAQSPQPVPLLIMTAVSAALAVLGYAWFHRLRKNFADVI